MPIKKNFMAPFYGWGSACLKVRATSRRQFTFYYNKRNYYVSPLKQEKINFSVVLIYAMSLIIKRFEKE